VSTLSSVELGVLGPLHVRQFGLPVAIPGAKPRSILTFLGLNGGAVVPGDSLVELLWGTDPPRTAAKALQTHISALRRALGDGFVLTQGMGWALNDADIDAVRFTAAAGQGRAAMAAGEASQAVACFDEALKLWRGAPELPDGRRGETARTRWIEGHAALVEDRADALLATGRAAELIGELEAAIADAPLRERRWGHLMLALYRSGRQGEALGAYRRVRQLLADELGVDPGPDLRRLESKIVMQDVSLEMPVAQIVSSVMRAVTFLLTDIEGSTAAWEADAGAMGAALARHDEIVEQAVTFRGGRLVKTRGEGDATFSVFDRPSAAAAAAVELQEAIRREPWALAESLRIRIALHTGEVEFRDGDYFGRAVNRAARLRSLAIGGQTLCSGATAELVIDSLADDAMLVDLGMRQLKNLTRPEHVFELRLDTTDDSCVPAAGVLAMDRPDLPAPLAGGGPFVGRVSELGQLLESWQATLDAGTRAVLIAGEPGVGKTRLAGEWAHQAYDHAAVVLYGRCDEDLGAPYQPFAEALRRLVPCMGSNRLRGLRGVESLLPLVPDLTEVLPDLAAAPRAAPDTERYALFDAVVALLGAASASVPIVLVLDDLHWAAKPTLLLLRHLLRFGETARVQIVGTYRNTDLDRAHPLAAMLANLHRDGSATRLTLSGLDESDVTAYVAEAGYDDDELARALASVTGGNPFFLIEALRHVDESGGRWDPNSLPQGVREAVSRRLSRLPVETNKALAAAAVVGSRFAVELVERVVEQDLVDAFDEAGKAGILFEEPGGHYRFNHAIVRQSLLAELASVRRMRLHHKIAVALESEPDVDGELLSELAYHYFECAWAGNAGKAAEYCRRAADQGMARLGYEGAADLYDKALHALEELDDELPDRVDQQAELLVARCEALLAAGDVVSAIGAVTQLHSAAGDSNRLAAWGTCFDGQLSMLTDPERLDEIEVAVGAAAGALAELGDAAGEAKAHTVRAGCLARLGRIGDCETALDQALTAARRAHEHRRVNAVLAGAPLAALWGPNPVPRAGGRCLDVVRLLRITTGSPVVEATSTRCQGVLDALRGRAAAGRQLIESARRTLNELGMRHAVLEVEQFAGIVELIADEPAAAEVHLRRAYLGFRRMGLEADTAETAALLARACLALDRVAEADELCTESQRLAGHAFKAAIAWRTVRAQLLSRRGAHGEARRTAEDAVAIAECTDALVDHGDACLALATVLDTAGDTAGARAATERAVGLYELKGAVALVEKAQCMVGECAVSTEVTPAEIPSTELQNACVQVVRRLESAAEHRVWDEYGDLYSPTALIASHRKIVGFTPDDLPTEDWPRIARNFADSGVVRHGSVVLAVRGQRLALMRLRIGGPETGHSAPQEDVLELYGLDDEGRIALRLWFDADDFERALAELESWHCRFGGERRHPPLENAASRVDARFNAIFARRQWDAIDSILRGDTRVEDRRAGLRREVTYDSITASAEIQAMADLGVQTMTSAVIAIRGERLALTRTRYAGRDTRPDAFHTDVLRVTEIDGDERFVASVVFDIDDLDAAIEDLDARYLAAEAVPHAHTYSVVAGAYAAFNRREVAATSPGWVNIDHRPGTAFAPGHMTAYLSEAWADSPDTRIFVDTVHRLSEFGAVVTHAATGISRAGFEAEWRDVNLLTVEGDLINRSELFDAEDLDRALARFDELNRPAAKLANAATRADDQAYALFANGQLDEIGALFAGDIRVEDRRHGLRRESNGRSAALDNIRAIADLGAVITNKPLALRGDRLSLSHVRFDERDSRPGAFSAESLEINEVDNDGVMLARIILDPDDIDAAFEELDARYVAGEGASRANTWSAITQAYSAMAQGQMPGTTPDLVNIDHRHVAPMAPDEGIAYLRASWDLAPEFKLYIEAVHRLSDLGAVFTRWSTGTSRGGFDAEWRAVDVVTVRGVSISRAEIFDESDLGAALARFDELNRPVSRLQCAASQAASRWAERFRHHFGAHDWQALGEMMADRFVLHDCRRTVNAGIRHGRDAEIDDLRAAADVGFTSVTFAEIATRGRYLALARVEWFGPEQPLGAFRNEWLGVVEIDAEERLAALVMFESDDIDAAFDELDSRFLAGEASRYAPAWSAVAGAFATINRHEIPASAPEVIDRRRIAVVGGEDAVASLPTAWDLTPDGRVYIECVFGLTHLGAVVAYVALGTEQGGFDAEWTSINVLTTDGDRIDRCELFDRDDLDTALARFGELSRRAPQPENSAWRVTKGIRTCLAARDWDGIRANLAADFFLDDRRKTVNGGTRRGRVVIEDLRMAAEVGFTEMTEELLAVRGRGLALTRARYTGSDGQQHAFYAEVLNVLEIDVDGRMTATVVFDVDDSDAAFAELDARYLAGEAAAHANTWACVTHTYAAFNRHELSNTTPGWVNIDHRRGVGSAPGDMNSYVSAFWGLVPDVSTRIVAVHRLSDLGAVFTHTESGTSHEGFAAEWREVALLTFDGDAIDRCELFDEADLEAALIRFDELDAPAPRLANAAIRMNAQLAEVFNDRDLEGYLNVCSPDARFDDRRRGIRYEGPIDASFGNALLFEAAASWQLEVESVAIRGENLVLGRYLFRDAAEVDRPVAIEALFVVEINADQLITRAAIFDAGDVDAAFVELDARYLAGEAAAHARTWSAIANANAAFNQHEIPPTTPDWTTVDHRRVIAFAPGDMTEYIRATWDVAPDMRNQIVAVHRLSDRGAVFTQAVNGTSHAGFGAEWRDVVVLTVDGDVLNRCEVFEEADLDAALSRFDELSRPLPPPLENAATLTWAGLTDAFNRRDVTDMLALTSADGELDDRRTGVRDLQDGSKRERVVQTMFEYPASWRLEVEHLAVRGARLCLSRQRLRDMDDAEQPITIELLTVLEVGDDGVAQVFVNFDPTDLDCATCELDARWMGSEDLDSGG
jgi:DNA-binding SARP family transcriptional activator